MRHSTLSISDLTANTQQTNYLSEEIQSISFQPTGRQCACGGIMRDTLLDCVYISLSLFLLAPQANLCKGEDPLPEEAYAIAEEHCKRADLVLCLGTSLRVHPANSLPIIAVRKNRAQLVIVNLQVRSRCLVDELVTLTHTLQRTPKDQYAHITIRARCDDVCKQKASSSRVTHYFSGNAACATRDVIRPVAVDPCRLSERPHAPGRRRFSFCDSHTPDWHETSIRGKRCSG